METEEKDLQDNQILEEPIEQEPEIADVGDAMVPEEDAERRNLLNQMLERERELTLVFQQKEKHVKGLTKKYESLKNQLWEQAKKERATATGVKIDSNLFREITMLKDKIQDKAHRIELLERELDSHKNQAEMDRGYHQRYRNIEEFQNYQKLANENPHLENYFRSEYYKSSLDKIQALKQLAEQLGFEVEKVTAIKGELEDDKAKFDSHLKQVRSEYKKLQDENERLAEEADKRKNSL